MQISNTNGQENKITALYCRLSVEDIKDGKEGRKNKEQESNSISNQKQILADYAKRNGYKNTMFLKTETHREKMEKG